MSRLLYIESSPRKGRSVSSAAGDAFVNAYVAAHPGTTVDRLDVWAEQLPELDQDAFNAKYAGLAGQDRTAAQEAAWQRLKSYADRFRAADRIVIGVPMWNFAIPYKLKQLIDLVSHKDLLFTFDERGLNGLLTHSKAFVIYARGIGYDGDSGMPSSVWDHQKPYLEQWLRFVGVPEIHSMEIEKTLFEENREQFQAHAAAVGSTF
ncbi:MAG: FMN-dependent NADH-azoreductase [Hyphomicrobium sp.]